MIKTGDSFFDAQFPGWNLNTPNPTGNSRSFRSQDIRFNQPFPAPPTVVVALSGIDSEGNLKVQLSPQDIEPEEFNIEIITWGDTVLNKALVTWIAFD